MATVVPISRAITHVLCNRAAKGLGGWGIPLSGEPSPRAGERLCKSRFLRANGAMVRNYHTSFASARNSMSLPEAVGEGHGLETERFYLFIACSWFYTRIDRGKPGRSAKASLHQAL